MKAFVITCFALASIYSQDLFACSYMIDQDSKTAELEKVGIASLGDVKILDSVVNAFTYVESKPTPMCPEELTYTLNLGVAFESGMNVCSGELVVTKVEPWVSGFDDMYIVSGRRNFRCKK